MNRLKSITLSLFLLLILGVSAQAAPEIYAIGNEQPPCCDFNMLAGEDRQVEACIICENDFPVDVLTNGPGILFPFADSILYMLDPETGQPTEVGPIGFPGCQGLEIHPVTEEIFAVCNDGRRFHGGEDPRQVVIGPIYGFGGQVLVKLDKETGEGTRIGNLIQGKEIGPIRVTDISFREDGVLFAYVVSPLGCKEEFPESEGAVSNNGPIGCGNQLGTIRLNDGYLDIIGPTDSFDQYSAIGFNERQHLTQCATLEFFQIVPMGPFGPFSNPVDIGTLNQLTGESSFEFSANFPDPFNEDRFNRISSKDMYFEGVILYGLLNSREFEENGIRVPSAVTNNNGPEGSFLITINQQNGAIEILGQISDLDTDFSAIAVNSKLTRNVPTMSEYGLIVTVVLLLGASVLYLRRRKLTTEN